MMKVIAIVFGIILLSSVTNFAFAESIPSWIKNSTGSWADGIIDDGDFISGIKYLIEHDIITIPDIVPASKSSDGIPSWIKNIAEWWTDGIIDDGDFISGMKYLVENGIISIEQKINFAMAGDFAVNESSKKNLQNIAGYDPEIILFLGDLRNDDGEPEGWFEMTEFLGDRVRVAIGNHDILNNKDETYREYYNMQNSYYSFDYQNVHFIVLASDLIVHRPSEQFKFLLDDLEKTKFSPDIDWIIVSQHEPMYTDGKLTYKRNPSTGRDYDVNDLWRNILQPLFDFYGVDLVVGGHNQFYERFKPLTFDGVVTDNELSNYVDPVGQIYITVGTGGDKIHQYGQQQSEMSAFQTTEHFGFLNLEVSDKRMDGTFINLQGDIIDSFSITKQTDSKTHGDLSYVDWSNTSLDGIDLKGKNLRGANFEGTDISGLDFTGADLAFVDLSSRDLSNVILDDAILFGTVLVRVNLSDRDFADANMRFANLSRSNFTGADFSNADLTSSTIYLSDFTNANLQNSDFSTADIISIIISGANITNANFQNSDIFDVDFTDLDVSKVNLSGSRLAGSDLTGLDLRNINLLNADFSAKYMLGESVPGTILSGANLSNMDLTETVFSRIETLTPDVDFGYAVNLTGANLSGADLSGKNKSYDNLVELNFKGANLSGADLSNSDLSGSDLSFADLTGANLDGANLGTANLYGANLDGANLDGANLDGTILDCKNHPICN